MEYITGVKLLLDFVVSCASVFNIFSKSNRKEKLSYWLYDIGMLIKSIADDFERQVYPAGQCAHMEVLTTSFKDIFKDVLPQEKIDSLHFMLEQVQQVERMYGELLQLKEKKRKKNIEELYIISGKFLGMSDLLNYSQ